MDGTCTRVIYTGISNARMEAQIATAVRMAQYPDGSLRLQGAFQWSQGTSSGHVWRDLPTVLVGVNGQELPNG